MDSRLGPGAKGTWRDAHDIQDTVLDRLMWPACLRTDQITDAAMARALHADACRVHAPGISKRLFRLGPLGLVRE